MHAAKAKFCQALQAIDGAVRFFAASGTMIIVPMLYMLATVQAFCQHQSGIMCLSVIKFTCHRPWLIWSAITQMSML